MSVGEMSVEFDRGAYVRVGKRLDPFLAIPHANLASGFFCENVHNTIQSLTKTIVPKGFFLLGLLWSLNKYRTTRH